MTRTVDSQTPTAKSRLASSITAKPSPPIWWAVIQLTGLASHIPLTLLTGSQSAIASTRSVVLVTAGVSIAAIVLYLLLAWKAMNPWKALALVSVIVIVFWYWNAGQGIGFIAGPLVAIIIYLLVAAAAVTYANRHLFKTLAFIIPATLAAALALMALIDVLSAPERSTGVQNPAQLETPASRPDVIVIVLDGYGRSDVIQDLYGYDNEPFLDSLRAQGFQVAEQSIANYSITHLSLPALMNMSYMHADGASIGNNDLHYLASQMSDENRVVSFFKENDYLFIHGESDHWFNVCGEAADVCLSAPRPDITGHALLERTPIGGFFYRTADNPTTALNLLRIEQLTNWNSTSSDWPSGPKLVLLHLELPHPPLYLDASCELRIDSDLGGHNLRMGDMTEEHLDFRKAAWIEQLECANATVGEFLSQVNAASIVAIVSDHGPDGTYVLDRDLLDQEGLNERLPSLTAIRLPEDCPARLPDDVSTVNVFRVILTCITGEAVPLVENRTYVAGFGGPIIEVQLAG